MRVTMHADGVPQEVESLFERRLGSFFQSPSWLAVLERSRPEWSAGAFVARDEAERVCGAFPFMRASRLGVRRIYAGPWGTYGGPIADEMQVAAALTRAVDAYVRSNRIALVRVHDFSGTAHELDATHGWSATPERCQVLDLPEDPRDLFRDAFTSKNRNKIRKAEKRGLRVREAHDSEALGSYARLYRDSSTRWGAERRLPPSLFESLAAAGDAVQVWLAELEDEPLAALLNFRCGGQIMNWGNVSRRTAWEHAPNNLLHWRALEAACRDVQGPRLYNFGSSAGLPGVHEFKASFGARDHVYTRFEYVAPWAKLLRRLRGN